MKKNGLSRLEMLVREAVEGSFGRLFGGYLEPTDVAVRLVQAMEDGALAGVETAAYDVLLNPKDHEALTAGNPQLADDLAREAWELGQRYGLVLATRPRIILVRDEQVRRHSVRIRARGAGAEQQALDSTQVVQRDPDDGRILKSLRERDAFLVVQGRRHVALEKPMVSIGRRPDNDIVIDSTTVSRQHAQIRWRFDRFVLYDVSGRGRTSVNGETVSEHVLRPGDVIALSDVLLVYAEGGDADEAKADRTTTDVTGTQVVRPDRS